MLNNRIFKNIKRIRRQNYLIRLWNIRRIEKETQKMNMESRLHLQEVKDLLELLRDMQREHLAKIKVDVRINQVLDYNLSQAESSYERLKILRH